MLDAARTLFSQHGYAATTMQAVAKLAETSVGNLYFQFNSKDALFLAVVDDLVREIAVTTDEARALFEPGLEQVVASFYTSIMATLAHRQLAALVLIGDGTASLRAEVLERFTMRVKDKVFGTASLPLGDEAVVFGTHAAIGSGFHLLGRYLSDETVKDSDLARFVAQWNCQALGYTPDTVKPLVAAVSERIHRAGVLERLKPRRGSVDITRA
jgi:AcrR family transcriptional regulator